MRRKLVLLVALIAAVVFFMGYYFYDGIYKKSYYNTSLSIGRDISLKKSLSVLPNSNSLPFKIYLKLRNSGRDIKAGEYQFEGNYSLEEIMDILESGKGKMVKITIPEGYSIKQIVEVLEKNGTIKKEKIL